MQVLSVSNAIRRVRSCPSQRVDTAQICCFEKAGRSSESVSIVVAQPRSLDRTIRPGGKTPTDTVWG